MSKKRATDKIAGISNAAVKKATNKTWARWLKNLDAAGATRMTHKDIAAHLYRKYPDIGGWWRQMVTVGYEQTRGLREKTKRQADFPSAAARPSPRQSPSCSRPGSKSAAGRAGSAARRLKSAKRP